MTSCGDCRTELDASWKLCPVCGSHVPEYRALIRKRVFEVIVLHASRGAPWKDTCIDAMQKNGITVSDVEEELKRRGKLPPDAAADDIDAKLPLKDKLADIRGALATITARSQAPVIGELASVIDELEHCLKDLEREVLQARKIKSEAVLQKDLSRDLSRAQTDPKNAPAP